MHAILIIKPPSESQRRHDIIAVMSAVWLKWGFLLYNLDDIFVYTGPRATKETQIVTPVHSTTRTASKSQPFLSTAKIESIAPGMTAV